jgi:enoyl-CoA hydratase/carnithine racemase
MENEQSTRFGSIRVEFTSDTVGLLSLARPEKSNAINETLWEELPLGLQYLQRQGARAIVISGEGKNFCAGLDVSVLETEASNSSDNDTVDSTDCQGRARLRFLSRLQALQDSMSALERCSCPVIAAVHGACFGAGVDLVTACDIRFCTADAKFCVKEVDLAITADMGTLARLPGIVGDGHARELSLTARVLPGEEARAIGMVSACFPSRSALMSHALSTAKLIAKKSPLAITGTKRILLDQRGKTVEDGLRNVAMWNSAMLPGSADVREVFAARSEGRSPVFSKL